MLVVSIMKICIFASSKEVSKNKHIKYSVVLSGFSVKLSVIITQRTTEETLRYTEAEGNNLKILIFDNS